MKKTENGSATKTIAAWAHGLKYPDIPDDVIEEAKSQILSVFGALFAGFTTEEGGIILKTVKGFNGGNESSVFPEGWKTSAPLAVLSNASLTMTLDYDDYLFAGHTGHSAVLVPLAWAEKLKLSGKELLLSQTIANEVEARAGAACLLGPQNGQQWSFIHTLGAACVTAKLLNFSEEHTLHAIGVSMYQPSFATFAGFMSGHAKVLTAGQTAMNGIYAALFAKEGLEGCTEILEDEKGFLHYFTYVPLPSMVSGFSKTWLTQTLSYKIYPGCAYVDSTADCVLEIVRHNDIDAEDVKTLNVYCNLLTVKMTEFSKPYLPDEKNHFVTSLNFSIPYNAAVCFLDKELTPAQFKAHRIKDAKVWKLAEKVRVIHDGKYTKGSTLMSHFSPHLTDILKKNGFFSLVPLMLERALGFSEITGILKSLNREDIEKQFKTRREKKTLTLEDMDMSDFTFPMGARVVVETKSGKKYEAETMVPRGASGTPFSEKRKCVEEKFLREAVPVLGNKKANEAMAIIEALDKADKKQVAKLLVLLHLKPAQK